MADDLQCALPLKLVAGGTNFRQRVVELLRLGIDRELLKDGGSGG